MCALNIQKVTLFNTEHEGGYPCIILFHIFRPISIFSLSDHIMMILGSEKMVSEKYFKVFSC